MASQNRSPKTIAILALTRVVSWGALYGLTTGIMATVRGTIPRELSGARNYGAVSGALSAPPLPAKAAGPLAIAIVMQRQPSPRVMLRLLLAFSAGSLLFFLLAARTHSGAPGQAVPPAVLETPVYIRN